MKDKKESRRQHPRFSVDIQVSVSVTDHELSARTRDISRAGLCLVTMEAITRDTEIDLELVLTFGEGRTSEPLHVHGSVVWCTSLFGAYQIGVKFVNIDDDQQRYLNMFIGFLDGSLSTGDGAFPHGQDGDESDDDEDATGRHVDPDDPFAA
jgi:c-di-GMP-binding flagellar brake protein YcgR